MAMGLKNVPATWSRLMNHISAKLTYNECLVYLDDIFEKMRESNLKFKPTKCRFLQHEAEYLGHIIKAGGYTG